VYIFGRRADSNPARPQTANAFSCRPGPGAQLQAQTRRPPAGQTAAHPQAKTAAQLRAEARA
jgi:hypothetical protein